MTHLSCLPEQLLRSSEQLILMDTESGLLRPDYTQPYGSVDNVITALLTYQRCIARMWFTWSKR